MKKKLLIWVGAVYSAMLFSGCGGNNNIPIKTTAGTIKTSGPVQDNIRKLIDPNMSDLFMATVNNRSIESINLNDSSYINGLINNNHTVYFKINYSFHHNINPKNDYCYAVINADNKVIGESFISCNYNNSQGAARIIHFNKGNNELIGNALYVNSVDKIWNYLGDQVIIKDSLNYITYNRQNHEATFKLHKDSYNNYRIFDVYVDNYSFDKNNYTIFNNKLKNIDNLEKLELLLTTLFVNFNQSKSVTY